jgi:hypothetical protein
MNQEFKKAASQKCKLVGEAAALHAGLVTEKAAGQARVVASDILHALKHDRTAQLLAVFLLFCLVCWEIPGINMVLYPFKLFVTIIHEACHALATRITGGQVSTIGIFANREGVTLTRDGFVPLIAMAGYIGTSVFGGLLIWWGRKPENAKLVLHSIGVVILAITAFYVGGGWFSFLCSLFIGASLLLIARKSSINFCHLFLLMLAVMTTLEGLVSIEELFLISALTDGHSDAKIMESLTQIPAVVWSILWGIISATILGFSFWYSYKPAKEVTLSPQQASVAPGTTSAGEQVREEQEPAPSLR